jgi:hypothetical protein
LARKLVKEMEDHKVSRPTHVSVRNRYTIFLCSEDYERLRDRRESLESKLENHLAKHVRAKKYDLPGDLKLEIVTDPDLKLGHFGILAERDALGLVEQDLPVRVRQQASAPARQEEPAPARPEALAPIEGGLAAPNGLPKAASIKTAAEAIGVSPAWGANGATQIIPREDAALQDLAWQTIVLKAGNREREFTQGRVIVGRGREADFRVDDSNVSRQHAAIFWSEGNVMIEDLGSTNGTMVNGYPISSTVVRSGDVIVIGDCRITVETR